VRIEPADIPGPTTLLRGAASDENIGTAAALTLRYITKVGPGGRVAVKVAPTGGEARTIEATAAADALARRWIISPEK
jgi:hypothetical protein